jgi:tetratricopeptide (TPR) repeat protein
VSDQYKYRAFISYSHADEKWAAWLHKSLETYKLPKHLVGQSTDYGPVPERIAPVFRDRDELATSTELGDVLTEALKQSDCLIVVCSPNAAQSRWTNEEILTYKRLGRQHRIFCLIVDGEPGASASPETADQECFPEALTYQIGDDGNLTDIRSEPIAADARAGKDNKQNAKLKLIAGMIGVGFNDLKQREQHRRHQRMVAITVAAAIGMAITTGLAATAWFARIEAEVQRTRAEAEAETAKQTTQFMVGLFEVSDPSEARGNTITAREILDKGAERIDTELADQPEVQATLMDTIGSVYKSLGLYPEANGLLARALEGRLDLYGEGDLQVAGSKTHLAEVLGLLADYDSAETMYRDALNTQRRSLHSEDPEVAETLLELAHVVSLQGKYGAAEPLIRESLEIRRALYGDRHLTVAKSLEDLGMNLFDQGQLDNAEPLLRDSVKMRRSLLDNRPYPELADGLNNLGLLLYEKGDLSGAEQYWRESLEMNRALYGEDHPYVAVSLNNLAFLYHYKGDYDAAEPIFREVVEMRKRLLGYDHPEVAVALNNLAFLLYDKGDQPAAFALARESLDINRRLFPDGHPEVAISLANLGGWLSDEGDYEKAEPMLREAVAMQKSLLGDDHEYVASSMTRLASLCLNTNRIDEAEKLGHDARVLFTKALSDRHWRTASAASIEGAALARRGSFAAAEKLLLESYAILKENEGVRDLYVKATLQYIVDLYVAWGKPDEAAKFDALLADVSMTSR